MTKNTKLRKITYNDQKIVYKDLTALEIATIDNIKNESIKYETAAKLSIVEPTDTIDIPIGILIQIGRNSYKNSVVPLGDQELFEITVAEFRERLRDEGSSPVPLIAEILKVLPGQSFTDLMKLTYLDLLELVCVCERIKGEQILTVKKGLPNKKGFKLVNTKDLPDDGKSLQQKMADLNNALGTN